MPSTAFFDLDGTLVDTTYLHTLAWWRALDDAGERRPMAAVHPLIGMGSSEMLGELIGRDDPGISEAHGRYFSEMHPLIRALPRAAEVIRRTKDQGTRAVVVTSSKPRDLPALLGPLGCDDAIDEVIHGEETPRAKPAPDLFLQALERTGSDPTSTVSLGDAVWDISAAGRAGIPCVAVASGGTDPHRLCDGGAVAVYRDCEELLARWDDSLLASGG